MVRIAALYKFTSFADPAALRGPLARIACRSGVKGTLLLAEEGINGTIAGPEQGIDDVLRHIQSLPGCAELDVKYAEAATLPFGRMKVRLKREIVTMGRPGVDPTAAVGRYVAPSDWNALIAAPDVVTIDTRNAYEVEAGTFAGAIDPQTESFGEFPAWWAANRARFEGKRVAMFCTGGIRCEKATNFLLSEGVGEVYHLKGGILSYLEEVPQAASRWEGQCFVFDERVSVGHGLAPGNLRLCRGCRRPLDLDDTTRPEFEEGVSCHRCHATTTPAQKARFRERQRQAERAACNGRR
ncbi:MAG: rhodanese-related sulfurtransferase [Paracoccaceae bacterium]|nr:rhodanese-related sulfurtransferase [Paracoccaceae bacterium]